MVLARPTDDELRDKIRELLPQIDLETMGLKAFVQRLSRDMDGVDLKPRKAFIKQVITDILNSKDNNEPEEESEGEASEEDDDEEEDELPQTNKSGKRGSGAGLSTLKEVSDKLADFLGQGKMMARTDIVKRLWMYIRENNLQNPDNKREIVLDDRMRTVFGCDRFTMFTINKYIGAHIHPFKPVDLTTSLSPAKKRKTTKYTPGRKKNGKKRKVGSQPPYRLSDELRDIVGTDILPRPQVVSKLWQYIKANNLQDASDKRLILCDDKLVKVMKKAKISMFEMNKCISDHLIEKVDRSAYHDEHGVADNDSHDDSSI